jgi:hypothetical protein
MSGGKTVTDLYQLLLASYDLQRQMLGSLFRLESKQETQLTDRIDGMDIVKTEVQKWLFPAPQPTNNTVSNVSLVSQ